MAGSGLDDPAVRTRLEAWLAGALGADRVELDGVRPLSGGAIQQNLALGLRVRGGPHDPGLEAVLRRDAPATIDESRSRAQEHALLAAAHAAGVTVPRPLGFCDDASVPGAPFSLVARVDGVGLGQKVVKDRTLGGDREALVERLGAELAAIHAIDPGGPSLGFLAAEAAALAGESADAPTGSADVAIARLRASLDALGATRPALEAGLRRLELAPPAARGRVLLHRDFRTGNLMLDGAGLTAILDWEFAGPGDPMEDLGWFCARCWRFSRPDLEAGGLGSRAAFYRGYEAASGRTVDDAAVRWWERYAHARWAVIALQQGRRHDSGRERSLSLALTGRLADGLELHLLDATMPAGRAGADAVGTDASGTAPGDGVPDVVPTPRTDARTDDDDLLDTVRETLAPLAGRLDGDDRLAVLMGVAALGAVGRARGLAARRSASRARLLEAVGVDDERALAGALRSGRRGNDAAADAAAARALLEATALDAWIARPADVDAALRARHRLAPGDGPPASA